MGTIPLQGRKESTLKKLLEIHSKELTMAKKTGFTKPMKLSADLAAIVGKKEASRAEVIKQLWAYLKKNNLQDPENKQYFTPDKKMAKIFGTDKIRGFGMAKFLASHLTELKNCYLYTQIFRLIILTSLANLLKLEYCEYSPEIF